MADLIDGNTGEVKGSARMEGEAPKAPRLGTLGDPVAFTCVATTQVEGYQPAKSDIMRGDVGTVTFQLAMPVGKVVARVERHQKSTGEGVLKLTFAPKFSRSEGNIQLDAEAQAWTANVLEQWKAYRAERRYPTVVLIPKTTLTSDGIAD